MSPWQYPCSEHPQRCLAGSGATHPTQPVLVCSPAQILLALALPPLGLGHIQPGRLYLSSLQASLAAQETEKRSFPATFWWLTIQGYFYTFQFLPQLLQHACVGLALRRGSVVMSLQNSCFSSNSCILPVLQWVTLSLTMNQVLPSWADHLLHLLVW